LFLLKFHKYFKKKVIYFKQKESSKIRIAKLGII